VFFVEEINVEIGVARKDILTGGRLFKLADRVDFVLAIEHR